MMEPQPPFDFHKAVAIGLAILTTLYTLRISLWFVMH